MKQIIFLVSILFVVSAYAQDSSVVNTKEIIDRMNKMDNPSLFSRSQFIEETSKFLEKVYGFHPASYQCALWMLADQMQIYMDATIGYIESGSVMVVNGRESAWLRVRDGALEAILKLQRLMGLTAASRLVAAKPEAVDINELLPYPK